MRNPSLFWGLVAQQLCVLRHRFVFPTGLALDKGFVYFFGPKIMIPATNEKVPPRIFGHNALPRTLAGTRIGGDGSY